MGKILAEIVSKDLPHATAVRAAIERGQILQSSPRVSVIAPRLLKGFWREHSADRQSNPQEAA